MGYVPLLGLMGNFTTHSRRVILEFLRNFGWIDFLVSSVIQKQRLSGSFLPPCMVAIFIYLDYQPGMERKKIL